MATARGLDRPSRPAVVVIGGANLDVKARSAAPALLATSNPGRVTTAPGGVGRNVAENLARLGTPTHLVTAVGRDAVGDDVLARTAAAGVRLDHVHRGAAATGTYVAVLAADGELLVAIADMGVTDELGPAQVESARGLVARAGLVVLDGNLSAAALGHALDVAATHGVRVVVDPVSVPKAATVGEVTAGRRLFAVAPNRAELAALTGRPVGTDGELRTAAHDLHRRGVAHVWVRLGPQGSVLSSAAGGTVSVPAATTTALADVTGAGDAGLAGFCHALLDGREPVAAATYGSAVAALTVASPRTVRPDLSAELVETVLSRLDPERTS